MQSIIYPKEKLWQIKTFVLSLFSLHYAESPKWLIYNGVSYTLRDIKEE